MESTKMVSLRIPNGKYEEILLDCESKSITVTEWFERQIVIAKKSKIVKSEILEKLEQISDYIENSPKRSIGKLRRLYIYINEEL